MASMNIVGPIVRALADNTSEDVDEEWLISASGDIAHDIDFHNVKTTGFSDAIIGWIGRQPSDSLSVASVSNAISELALSFEYTEHKF